MPQCAWHLCHNEAKRVYCSLACKNKTAVTKARKSLKLKAVALLGGKCCRCGYDKCVSALEFHHTDPTQKDFAISSGGINRSWDRVKTELLKCILVCANCHAEIHETKLVS